MGKTLTAEEEDIMNYFQFKHLPESLQDVSRPFCELARKTANESVGPEVIACLRKLLEAKDCAVRAAI